MTSSDLRAKLDMARQRWSLAHLSAIATTATSHLFKVAHTNGPAVLKVLTAYGADEIHGADLMVWYGGHGSARILDIHDGMILMEWLDGGPLGDLVRAGRDKDATDILCHVMQTLHEPRSGPHGTWQRLSQQFETLFAADPAHWPAPQRDQFIRAKTLARHLIATTPRIIPLHGDCHHDNIMRSGRGWLAIDPKGLMGDPAYEAANAFRNPLGALDLIVQPDRIDHLATRFAAALHCERWRVLGWAAAHSALSTCWARQAGRTIDWDVTVLPHLLRAIDRTDNLGR